MCNEIYDAITQPNAFSAVYLCVFVYIYVGMHEIIVTEVGRKQLLACMPIMFIVIVTTVLPVAECRVWQPPTPGHGQTLDDVHTY